MRKKSVLIFDFDGTLVDSTDLECESIIQTVRDFGKGDFTKEEIFRHYGPTETGIVADMVGEEDAPAAIAYFFERYTELQKTLLRKDDRITSLLEKLSALPNLLVLLVTGRSRETLDISLEYLNYGRFFARSYTGSDKGINKDESIGKVLDDFGVTKEDVLYIGDSNADVRTMQSIDVDIISASYFRSGEDASDLDTLNPGRVAHSIEELDTMIGKEIEEK